VLERLAAQKELTYDNDDGKGEDPFLFLPNLRDDVLRSQHSLAARERVWQLVRAVVEQNSNVRTGQREGANGEVGRAWEWIGPVGGTPEVAERRRRRSGRVSWGPEVRDAAEVEDRAAASSRWQESRPMY
jgi:hypothetical protein